MPASPPPVRRALLLGGTGFVGRHLAASLANRYAVTATGRSRDLRDLDVVRDLVRPGFDVVVHLAAVTTIRESFERPQETHDVAVQGMRNLLQALGEAGFGGRLLYVASSEVYGQPAPADLPLTETAALRPGTPYAMAKAAAEALAIEWSATGRFDVVVARPFTHIGPGQSHRFAIANIAGQIARIRAGRREPVVRIGDLSASRDLTDVRDVAWAYELMLEKAANGFTYNVCSGREVPLERAAGRLIELSGMDIRLETEPGQTRPEEPVRTQGSYALLARDTGWAPSLTLEQTLADLLAFEMAELACSA